MYVGHGLLGIALGGTLARAIGLDRSRALAVALLTGAFAVVPDVDMARTAYAVATAGPGAVFPTTEHVWTKSWVVHRSLTHSLVSAALAVAMAVGVATLVRDQSGRSRPVQLGIAGLTVGALLALGWIARASDALLGVGIMVLYSGAVLLVAGYAARRSVTPRHVGLAALVGLGSHPFGDVWMGTPPSFLYPVVTTPPIDTVVFAADPTINLLLLFGIEIALGWAALAVITDLAGHTLWPHLDPQAALGVGFAGAMPFIPPPTLEVAYQFALGTIATGLVLGVAPAAWPDRLSLRDGGPSVPPRDRRLAVLVTALAGATASLVGYLVAYLVVGPT